MKKTIFLTVIMITVIACTAFFVGCDVKSEYDLNLPDLSIDGWRETLNTDFRELDTLDGSVWTASPHGIRKDENWCDDMLEFTDEGLVVHSIRTDNHVCSTGQCERNSGLFTSGIETRKIVKGEDGKSSSDLLFAQTFGYYEAKVKVPRGLGMWSAFWLQSADVGKIGNGGKDGAEIDIYESSFILKNPTKTGSCIHVDAYDPPFYGSKGNVTDVGYNLYDGEFHTYALFWTPDCYVVFVDGKETWRTDYGVSLTPEFLRLTVEIRERGLGPYGQTLGKFDNEYGDKNDFVIEYVKAYQNSEFEPFIKKASDFSDKRDLYTNLIITFSVFGGMAVLTLVSALVMKKGRKKAAKSSEEKSEEIEQ